MNIEQDPEKKTPPGFDLRYTEASDVAFLKAWLIQPESVPWYPMSTEAEAEDAAQRWVSFYKLKCSLTATIEGEPCGLATLYLQPYRTLVHQCEFGIIVSNKFRNLGIGGQLIRNIMHLAKNYFNIELLHLQVQAHNPAMRLYRRYGFREFGRQTHWLKEDGVYRSRVFMERFL